MKSKLQILKEDFQYDFNANANRLISIVESGVLSDMNIINKVVNYLRDALLRMEHSKTITSKEVDDLDDKHDGDWESWIVDAIKIVPDKTINKILDFLGEYIN